VGDPIQPATVVSKEGHIILPNAICDAMGWVPGTRLAIEYVRGGLLVKQTTAFAPSAIDILFGSFRHAGPALSVEDTHAAIVREAADRSDD
jgi:bifunctional DNA-binding transcriptional regulator/antitoxin component of YhaV-PrlF toxin-antitoxin module